MHATVGATVGGHACSVCGGLPRPRQVLCVCVRAVRVVYSTQVVRTVTGWGLGCPHGLPRYIVARSAVHTVPDFTGSCPHIACVSPGAFRNTSAQPGPIKFPNRVGRMHRRHAVLRKKAGLWRGSGDASISSHVLRRPRPKSQSRRGRPQASPRRMPAAPGAA